MRNRKNAVLLFSKPPVPGLVKTRLSTLKDGVFTPEVASALYHCMFFDVVEICCDALRDLEAEAEGAAGDVCDAYDIIISTTPAENVAVMKKLFADSGTWPRPLRIIADTGASFDEHYTHAFDQTWEMGYDCILSMGCDMPALPRDVVKQGFRHLHELEAARGGCVVSADQAMGVSIIGWTRDTNMDHWGVFYNPDGLTVLPAYVAKARERGVPMRQLEPVPDVDSMLDLMHNVTLVEFTEYCAQHQDLSVPWRTIDALRQIGWSEVRVPPNELRDSREGIDV